MFNSNGLYGVRGVMFDCYKTLIDIKTDEKDLKTYEPVSKWLMYHGVNISPHNLMNEYRWRCKEELERRGEWHCESCWATANRTATRRSTASASNWGEWWPPGHRSCSGRRSAVLAMSRATRA